MCAWKRACARSGEGTYKPSDFCSCSQRMDLSLRRKDIWIVGSVCFLSSSLLWRVFRSMMTRGGHRQAPALEDTQVVTSLLTKTDSFTVLFECCQPGSGVCQRRWNACPFLILAQGHCLRRGCDNNSGMWHISTFQSLAPTFGEPQRSYS